VFVPGYLGEPRDRYQNIPGPGVLRGKPGETAGLAGTGPAKGRVPPLA